VAKTLGIGNLLWADLLIKRAERANVDWDKVNWDAIQVMGNHTEFSEFVQQLNKQLGLRTVTAHQARSMVEVRPGKFVYIISGRENYERKFGTKL
jgi:hypothetical protein